MEEKSDTWTITAELTVFAGDMDKENVISNAEDLLGDLTDGTDFTGFAVINAKRDGELPDEINITWCIDDVKGLDDTLTDEQARRVLQAVAHNSDATIGVTWDTLEFWIDKIKEEDKS